MKVQGNPNGGITTLGITGTMEKNLVMDICKVCKNKPWGSKMSTVKSRFGSWRHPSFSPIAVFVLLYAHFTTADTLTLGVRAVSAVTAQFR